jgi:uncharacterized membrane protein
MAVEETRTQRRIFRIGFVAVYAVAIAGFIHLGATSGAAAVREQLTLALTSLAVFGKFIIFAPVPSRGPWDLALMVWMIDLMIAFALSSGLERFEATPVLGALLARTRRRAMRTLAEYPRLQRTAFAGVTIFVLLPIASTGAVTGCVAARFLGLSRLSGVAAIALGSAGTTTLLAALATFLGDQGEAMLRSPLLTATMGAGMLVLIWIMIRRAKRVLRS